MINHAAFDVFLQRIPEHVIVVVDEAYDDYVEAEDFSTDTLLFKTRTLAGYFEDLSKIYGLAGLRVGYCLALKPCSKSFIASDRPIMSILLPRRPPALAALTDTEHIQKSREVNLQGKRYLYCAFKELGLSYLPTQGNFILIDCGRDAAPIAQKLLRSGVIVCPA